MKYRPYALLAELTHRCPLHCPYCSNPVNVSSTPRTATLAATSAARTGQSGARRSGNVPASAAEDSGSYNGRGAVASAVSSGKFSANDIGTTNVATRELELTTDEWQRVISEAAALGVLQLGLSGGEPLQRQDLAQIIRSAREAGLYTNLITSGIGLDLRRAISLREAGLDSAQISFQADEAVLADSIAGTHAHQRKIQAARAVRDTGIALSANVVLHRCNLGRLREIISFIESIGAQRLELAHTQYYGWAFLNRAQLLPSAGQVSDARAIAEEAKQRLGGRMEIFYVLPDYFESRPKPCLNGWGSRYITVNPIGEVLPCPTAASIPDLKFDSVRTRSLAWIWNESESFNRFRGTEWMPEPCRSCPQKEIDFGGCRCQAALVTGNAANTDPVCEFSPHRRLVNAAIADINGTGPFVFRRNPPPIFTH